MFSINTYKKILEKFKICILNTYNTNERNNFLDLQFFMARKNREEGIVLTEKEILECVEYYKWLEKTSCIDETLTVTANEKLRAVILVLEWTLEGKS